MTDKELREIKARANDASSGPWEAHRYSVDNWNGNHICGDFVHENDKKFTAHARTDIPKLIEEIERLRELNRWIPVEERLPENCGQGVLLTVENNFYQRKVIVGFTGYMEKGKLEFHTNDKETDLKFWKVIAWRELPENYVQ